MVVEGELVTGGVELDAPGATWTGVAVAEEGDTVAELLLLSGAGVAASPDVEGGAGGVVTGSAEAGLGDDGTLGALATLAVAACKGAAAPTAGGTGPTWVGVVVEPFDAAADAAAVLAALVSPGFIPPLADFCAVVVGDAAVCTV